MIYPSDQSFEKINFIALCYSEKATIIIYFWQVDSDFNNSQM